MFEIWKEVYVANSRSRVNTVQDFVCEIGMKPRMHKSSKNNIFFSIFHDIVRMIKELSKDCEILILEVIFLVLNICGIFIKRISAKNIRLGDQLSIFEVFWKRWFLKILYFLKMSPILLTICIILVGLTMIWHSEKWMIYTMHIWLHAQLAKKFF